MTNNDGFNTRFGDIHKGARVCLGYNFDVLKRRSVLFPCDDSDRCILTKLWNIKAFDADTVVMHHNAGLTDIKLRGALYYPQQS